MMSPLERLSPWLFTIGLFVVWELGCRIFKIDPEFVRKAPEEIIEGEKEKREEAEGRRAKILEALERLKGAA